MEITEKPHLGELGCRRQNFCGFCGISVKSKQLLTYLRLMDKRVGLLVNFNTDDILTSIKRIVN